MRLAQKLKAFNNTMVEKNIRLEAISCPNKIDSLAISLMLLLQNTLIIVEDKGKKWKM